MLAAAASGVGLHAGEGRAGEGSSFFEDFHVLDNDLWAMSDGWSNGAEWSCGWNAKAVAIQSEAALSIIEVPAGEKPLSCGELQTRQTYGYGTFEVRMRPVELPGVTSAFFVYTGPHAGDPKDGIDIRFVGESPTELRAAHSAAGRTSQSAVDLGFEATGGFNDYAFQWSREGIRWYVNGRMVHEVTAAGGDVPTHPGRIYLHLWPGGHPDGSSGLFAYPGQRLSAKFQYVAFTAEGDGCQFPTSIICPAEAGHAPMGN
ncbi:family 16 glycosylhydrolase [Aureimonas populi]|uniref:Family 16 glycosylhydrolase n=1 Tax=Aureimonas populi TaxID=1701758 RepID=A0ABW5CJN2_9HYPH|nr:family 16 glycosylhydrolase [Aureimonas populi]